MLTMSSGVDTIWTSDALEVGPENGDRKRGESEKREHFDCQ